MPGLCCGEIKSLWWGEGFPSWADWLRLLRDPDHPSNPPASCVHPGTDQVEACGWIKANLSLLLWKPGHRQPSNGECNLILVHSGQCNCHRKFITRSLQAEPLHLRVNFLLWNGDNTSQCAEVSGFRQEGPLSSWHCFPANLGCYLQPPSKSVCTEHWLL